MISDNFQRSVSDIFDGQKRPASTEAAPANAEPAEDSVPAEEETSAESEEGAAADDGASAEE